MVCTSDVPWFIEIMDKKFTIATYITSFQLLPPIHRLIEDQRSHFVKNVLADYIFERATDEVFTALVDACSSPSDASLRDQLRVLIELAQSAPAEEVQSVALLELAQDALKDYEDAVDSGEIDAHKRYLPPPDKSKHDKPIWMLPNQTAFTNICARINLHHKGDLPHVRLVHDEQHQFDEVLKVSN